MTIWITTNGRPSNSAALLAQYPGFKRAFKGNKVKPSDFVINWGSSVVGNAKLMSAKAFLNLEECVSIASNKLKAFEEFVLAGIATPLWTTSQAEAQKWSNEGSVVVVRNKLTGHSGDGIMIVEKGQEVPEAPLYTKYIFKEREFRVHVVNSDVIDTQQKIRDPDREPTTWKVRSHQNGFIYARNNVEPSDARDSLAVAAVCALGLDFGAVDLVEDKKGNFYVLEVNTAPGLEGQTLENYAEAFTKWSQN